IRGPIVKINASLILLFWGKVLRFFAHVYREDKCLFWDVCCSCVSLVCVSRVCVCVCPSCVCVTCAASWPGLSSLYFRDCHCLTDGDLSYVPEPRRKPDSLSPPSVF